MRSRPTPTPPATVNAPSEALVLAVVAEIPTTPPEEIEIASGSDAEPIVPASLIRISSTKVTIPVDAIEIADVELVTPIVAASFKIKSSTRVTIPVEAIVIAVVADAAPIVPPSLIKISSTKVTIPVDATVIADVDEAEPIVPASAINIALEVRLVTPVTTPASTLTVPSNTIAEPLAGVILTAPEEAEMVLPFMFTLSTCKAVSVPTEVIPVCAAAVKVPVIA